jgi:hypothetical protein
MIRPPALFLAAWGAWIAPAAAQDCRLALVLALDVSSSVDAAEDRLQRDGLAAALVSPQVMQAALSSGPVALYAFEWSGSTSQVAITDSWEWITREEDLRRVAGRVAASPRSRFNLPTAVGPALAHAALVLRDGPQCRRRTIDISGDGMHNEGYPPRVAYRIFPLDGVTVNALVVGGASDSAELVAWFQAEVLRGPGAFSLFVETYESYAEAMEAKLIREFEGPVVGKGRTP